MDNDGQSEVSSTEQGDIKRAGMTISQFLSVHGIEEIPKDLTSSDSDIKTDSTASSILVEKDGRKYDVGKVVAKGGMGAILSARDLNISRTVAMKVMLDPDQASKDNILRFIEEAKVTGQLEHPSIVPIHELGVNENDNVFYTMKFVKGMNLDDILKQISEGNRKVIEEYPLSRLLNIFLKTCDAMSFSHHKGVIHRDLKPENIMVGDYGEVLVMDWGLSKIVGKETSSAKNSRNDKIPDEIVSSLRDEDAGSAMMTMEGTIMGTPAFMPPEQAKGELDHLDTRSDIYSLGGILYNILTLHPPVEADNINQVLMKVIKGDILSPTLYNTTSSSVKKSDADLKQLSKEDKRKQALSKAIGKHQALKELSNLPHCPGDRIPKALASVAMKAMALKQEERYQTVAELQKDIEAYQGGFATSAQEAGLLTQLLLLVKRHKGVFGSIAVGLLLLIVIVASFVVRLNKEKKLAQENELQAKTARDEADKNYQELQNISKKAAPEFIAKAQKLMDNSNWDEAINAVNTALDLDKTNRSAWYLKGRLMLGKLKFSQAEHAFREAGKLDKHNLKKLAAKCLKYGYSENVDTKKKTKIKIRLGNILKDIDRTTSAYLLQGMGNMLNIRFEAVRDALERANPSAKPIRMNYSTQGKITLFLSSNKNLKDISAIKGLPLQILRLSNTSVSNISCLKGMLLEELVLNGTVVSDIKALAGMPLHDLNLLNTKVNDINPLKGLPLEYLNLQNSPVKDINALKGMPLKILNLTNTLVKDINVLEGMPLESLSLDRIKARDFNILKKFRFKRLSLRGTCITNFDFLKNMPLESLTLSNTEFSDVSILKGMPLENLNLSRTKVKTIDSLKGIKLKTFDISYTRIENIDVLSKMSLKKLNLESSQVRNINALKGTPLKELNIGRCKIDDLTPLTTCKSLERLVIPHQCKNIELLKTLPNLKYVSYDSYSKPTTSKQFWKKWDAEKKK